MSSIEDLGFVDIPPAAFANSAFEDVLIEPGPASFFLQGRNGEDIMLGQGVKEIKEKLGFGNLFDDSFDTMNGHSPLNVDDDFSFKDHDPDVPIDVSFSLEDIKQEGLVLLDGIIQDVNGEDEVLDLIDPLDVMDEAEHSEAAGGEEEHVCRVCNVSMLGLAEVLSHLTSVHCGKQCLCTLCDSVLSTLSSLKKHVRNVHFRMEAFECPVCKKAIHQRSQLRKHIEKVHGGKKGLKKVHLLKNKPGRPPKLNADSSDVNDLTCHLCQRRYLSKETRDRHLVTFHRQNNQGEKVTDAFLNQSIKCTSCGVLCMSSGHMKRHLKQAHGPGSSKYVGLACPICRKVLADAETKQHHVRAVHHNMRSFPCEVCQKNFYSQLHVTAHKKTVHHRSAAVLPARKETVHCEYPYCKAAFKNNDRLLQHVEEFHAYQCPECPRHLQTTSGLAKHYKKAHISNELLCCMQCGNCYKEENELQKHIADKHEGSSNNGILSMDDEEDSMLAMDESTNNSSSHQSLLIERKTVHPRTWEDIKRSVAKAKLAVGPGSQLPCEFCRATDTFSSESDLLHHIEMQHPYRCPDCPPKMFKYPTSVRKHFRKYHRHVQPFFCKLCTIVYKSGQEAEEHMVTEHNVASGSSSSFSPTTSSYSSPHSESFKYSTSNHMTTSTPSKQSFCVLCHIQFESQRVLLDHCTENHAFKCPMCSKDYRLVDSLRKHFKAFHDMDVTLSFCKLCNEIFTDASQRVKHMLKVHSVSESIQIIPVHTSPPIEPPSPQQQRLSAAGAETYHCPRCPKTYNVTDSLRKHAKSVHNLTVLFCRDCVMTFTDGTLKAKHMTDVHGKDSSNITSSSQERSINVRPIIKKEDMFQCPKCSRSYNIAKSLRKHCRKNHDKLSICFCRACTKVFTSVAKRDRHQEIEHPDTTTSSPEFMTNGEHEPAAKKSLLHAKPLAAAAAKPLIQQRFVTLPGSRTVAMSATNNVMKTPPRVIVLNGLLGKKIVTSPGNMMKTVEVVQLQSSQQQQTVKKCCMCQEAVSDLTSHVCDLPYQCPLCPRRYKQVVGARKHCIESHGRSDVVVCEICHLVMLGQQSECDKHVAEKHLSPPSLRGVKRTASSSTSPIAVVYKSPVKGRETSPEVFHGFSTPTKELERIKELQTFRQNLLM